MRLIDADELMEHVWRDRLDSRESIAKMIDDAPTVKEISTKIPINVFEQLISQEPKTDVLDKIGAEIEQIYQEIDTYSHNEYENAVEQGKEIAYENVMQIIDKYRTEGGGDNE